MGVPPRFLAGLGNLANLLPVKSYHYNIYGCHIFYVMLQYPSVAYRCAQQGNKEGKEI